MALLHKHHLAEIRILIADHDHQMATVLAYMLKRMGFSKIHHSRNGKDAIGFLMKHPVDIVITDWQMPYTDGIELARFIRQSDDSPNRALPVIMLTARAERPDVETSRDEGITEFVVKPYTSKTLFDRIEQLVDNPRDFIIAPSFTGPTRRRREAANTSNRRTHNPKPVNTVAGITGDDGIPKMLPVDFALKKRIGLNKESLSTIITPAILDEAQKAIDTLKDESLGWIKEDLKALESFYKELMGHPNIGLIETMKGLLLSVKSRAGTFGYKNASDAAQIIYRFMRNDYTLGNTQHNKALLKNIQALKVLLGNSAQGKDEAIGQLLLKELQTMATKFQNNNN